MSTPLAPDRTRKALAALEAPLARAIASARTRDIDEQQVAVARLADVATKLRAAQDLAAYAATAGGDLPGAGGGLRGPRRGRGRAARARLRRRARARRTRTCRARRRRPSRARRWPTSACARSGARSRSSAGATTAPLDEMLVLGARRRARLHRERGRAARRAHPPQRRAGLRGVPVEDGRARLLRAVGPRGVRRRRDGQRRHVHHHRGALARLARGGRLADHAARDPDQGAARGRHRGAEARTGCRRSPPAS